MYSEEFEKRDFTAVEKFPEAHTIEGRKVPPDGVEEPTTLKILPSDVFPSGPLMESKPIGLSYPGQQDFGPYVQHCGEGLSSSFILNLTNGIPFSCGNVHPHTAMMLFTLVLNQRPQFIIETGTFYGYSTWFMAEALRILGDAATVFTIDPDPKFIAEEVKAHPNIVCVEGRSEVVLPNLLSDLGEVQFSFIDSWKRLAYLEFQMVKGYLPEGGIAAFHDTQFLNTGRTLWQKFSGNRDLKKNWDQMLFCGTPHKANPHRYFGNADDRGFMVLRKKEVDPWLNVWDANTTTDGDGVFENTK